jgi:hypothetical protein
VSQPCAGEILNRRRRFNGARGGKSRTHTVPAK